MNTSLDGIYPAIVTPFDQTGLPAFDTLSHLLHHLDQVGCHGVLIAGTTGEGPSLNLAERTALFKAAAAHRGHLKLLAGTGAASLTDAIELTRAAFDAGFDAVLVVPPFYFRNAQQTDLHAFYEAVIQRAVPGDGNLLFYHIPQVSGVPVEHDLIRRLKDQYPNQIAGIKDSSGSQENARQLNTDFDDFAVLVGNDRLLADSLAHGGAGGITALANVFPELLLRVYDAFHNGQPTDAAQEQLSDHRQRLDSLGLGGAAGIKSLLMQAGLLPDASVRPPLRPATEAEQQALSDTFNLQGQSTQPG